jgi:hypothetical protein
MNGSLAAGASADKLTAFEYDYVVQLCLSKPGRECPSCLKGIETRFTDNPQSPLATLVSTTVK